MKIRSDQSGALNVLLIPLIISVLFLLSFIGFGVWAFLGRQDYKNNSDKKSDAAVAIAIKKTQDEKDNEFIQKEKEPLKSYTSPSQYGSFTFKYPKTWSAYSAEQTNQLTMTLQPDVVSSNPKTPYALKIEVINTPYDTIVNQFNTDIKQGKVEATSYSLPSVPDVIGLRFDGEISNKKSGSAVYLPIRGQTIKIYTESEEKLADFDDIILKYFEFRP